MRLIYRIALRLTMIMVPLMAVWAGFFYFAVVDEVNDETDDTLDSFSQVIIMKMLAGREMPPPETGTNNSYSIMPVDSLYAEQNKKIRYYDSEMYIPEKRETEPARILSTVFRDDDGQYYRLDVFTPAIDKEDLLRAIALWVVALYLSMLFIAVGVSLYVLNRNMRPLYSLLEWLDRYRLGGKNPPLPDDTDIVEFRKLNEGAQAALDRIEQTFEKQKQFIGNASHELQTPMAVIANRVEWLVDNTDLTEEQLGELLRIRKTLDDVVRLNKTLLMLTKIDNRQFPEASDVDITALSEEVLSAYDEIYSGKGLYVKRDFEAPLVVRMNTTLAYALISNLLKNAYSHSPEGGHITVTIRDRQFLIANDGDAELDKDRIFERFYKGSGREGSAGLGLAIVRSVQRYYDLRVEYAFMNGMHVFSVLWK